MTSYTHVLAYAVPACTLPETTSFPDDRWRRPTSPYADIIRRFNTFNSTTSHQEVTCWWRSVTPARTALRSVSAYKKSHDPETSPLSRIWALSPLFSAAEAGTPLPVSLVLTIY